MAPKSRIFVTGASGFVGAQVVAHLLDAGYAVRGASRKPEQLQKNNPHPDFDVAHTEDIISADLSSHLIGISAVIHVASPMAGRGNVIQTAVEGTLNVLHQAHANKVYKVTILSSFATLFSTGAEIMDSSRTFTDTDWRQLTELDMANFKAGTAHPMMEYAASKTLAERAVWDFVDTHPEMDVITILPPFIYGPIAPSQVITDRTTMLSTNKDIYDLFNRPSASYPPTSLPHSVDVRDVAKACVLSLTAKNHTNPKEKRRIILYGGSFGWKEAARHIAKVRPNLKNRVVDGGEVGPVQHVSGAKLDTSKASEILGLDTFISWEKMVEDAVDSILALESSWA